MAFLNLKPIGSYQVVNGQVVPQKGSYLEDVDQVLKDYYLNLLALEGGNVEMAKRRLMEDYGSGKRVTLEDYERNIKYGQETYQGSLAELQDQSLQEKRQLETDLLQRGVSQGGLAEQKTGEIKSRQDLRREAIDRALRKSEEDLKFGKERGLEDITKTQTRGTEDVATQFAKFKMQQDQERKEKGMGLAEQAYGRELSRQATEKGFEFQQKAMGG